MPGNKHKMSEYSNSQIFPQFRPHSNSELIAEREMEKLPSPRGNSITFIFLFSMKLGNKLKETIIES